MGDKNIKGLLFDMGGVYLKQEDDFFGKVEAYFGERIKLPRGFRVSLGDDIMKGEKDIAEYIEEKLGKELSSFERMLITTWWSSAYKLNVKLAKKIAKEYVGKFKLGIASNMDSGNLKAYRKRGILDYFEAQTFSCEEKLVKPNKEFFIKAIEKMGLKPEEILFIDDQGINLKYAAELGCKTYKYTDNGELFKYIEKIK